MLAILACSPDGRATVGRFDPGNVTSPDRAPYASQQADSKLENNRVGRGMMISGS